jgi:endonuclease VIII
MPEGPEIRRAADRLAAAVVGTPLTLAWFALPALKPHGKRLIGHRITAIVPHGKALLTHFDHGWTLYSHNQLYGVWRIAAAGERPETTRSLRVALETAEQAILLYSASDIAMWRTEELDRHPFLAKLGPDVLDATLTADAVAERLHDARFRGRNLGALLLDQAFLAGMGNYLRSEVLFEARLRPERRPGELSPQETRRLAAELLAVPRRSYATRGIAPASGMRPDYLTDTPDGFRFAVFDREGAPCPACGGEILRQETGSRRLYLCPRCQR